MRTLADLGLQNLDRDIAIKAQVVGRKNIGHPTTGDQSHAFTKVSTAGGPDPAPSSCLKNT